MSQSRRKEYVHPLRGHIRYVHEDGTVHDRNSTEDWAGKRKDTRILDQEAIEAIVREYYARETPWEVKQVLISAGPDLIVTVVFEEEGPPGYYTPFG
jgi:hypothetical protein